MLKVINTFDLDSLLPIIICKVGILPSYLIFKAICEDKLHEVCCISLVHQGCIAGSFPSQLILNNGL